MISIEEGNSILGSRLGNRSPESVSTWYIGLSSTSISEDGTGITEPSGSSGYKRVAIQNNSSQFTVPSNLSVKNAKPIVFNEISTECPTVTDVFLSSSPSGGKAAYYGKFTVPRPMPAQSTLTIGTGDAVFKIVNIR